MTNETRAQKFNRLIKELQALKDAGKRNTPEYLEKVDQANKANPGQTPIGFYLD